MVDEFIEFTRPIIEKSRAEEGCISYTLYQDPSDATKFIFFEQWKDQAAIDYHFSTDHFKLAGSRPDFEAAPTVLTIYDACPVKQASYRLHGPVIYRHKIKGCTRRVEPFPYSRRVTLKMEIPGSYREIDKYAHYIGYGCYQRGAGRCGVQFQLYKDER